MVEKSPGVLFLDVGNPRVGFSPLHDVPASCGRPKMDLSTAPVFAMEPTGDKALLDRYQAAFSSLLSFHIKMEDIILSNKKRRRQSEEVGKMLTNLTETLSTPVHLKVRMSLDPSRDKQLSKDVTITLTPPRPPHGSGSGKGSRRAASSSKSPYKSSPYRLVSSQSKAGIARSPSARKQSPSGRASGTVLGTGVPKAADAFKLYFSMQSTPSHSTRSPLPLYVSSPSDIAALQQLVTGVGSMLANAGTGTGTRSGTGTGTGTATVGSDRESSSASSVSTSRPRKTQTPLKPKQLVPQARTPGTGTGTGTPRRKPSSWSVGRVATIMTPAPAALGQEAPTPLCLNTPAPAAAPPAAVFGSRGGRLARTPPPPQSASKLSPRGRPSLGSALSKGVLSPQPQLQPQLSKGVLSPQPQLQPQPKLSLSPKPKPQPQPQPHNPSNCPTTPGVSMKTSQPQSASGSKASVSSSLSPRTCSLQRSGSPSPCPGPNSSSGSGSSSSSSSSSRSGSSSSAVKSATASASAAMSPRTPVQASASASASPSAYSPRGCDSASRRKLLLASTESLLAELGACLG